MNLLGINMNRYYILFLLILIILTIGGCVPIPSIKFACLGDWYSYYLQIDNQTNEDIIFYVKQKGIIAIEPFTVNSLSNKKINLLNNRLCKVKYYELFKNDFVIFCNLENSGTTITKSNKDIDIILSETYLSSYTIRKYIYKFIIRNNDIVNIDDSPKEYK
jgi:hypothetical protein